MVDNDWPAWATEQVEIHPWDATWHQQAADLIAVLQPPLEGWLEGHIEHVGSTAVDGLAAKPVIDLQAPVASLVGSELVHGVLVQAGWHLVPPELDRRPWRRLWVMAEGDRRVAHLHLVEADNPRCQQTLAFRDRLRQQPALAKQYEHLKRIAAQEHRSDREDYTDAKAAFIRSVVADLM